MVDVRIIPKPMKSLSNCYIDFDSEESAKRACSIDRKVVEGKTIFVALSKPPEKDVSSWTLFINDLPYNLKREDLDRALNFCKSDILESRYNGKTYAHVSFKDEASMKRHLKVLKNFSIGGRKIVAKIADQSRDNRGHRAHGSNGKHPGSGWKEAENGYKKESKDKEEEGNLGKRQPFNESSADRLPANEGSTRGHTVNPSPADIKSTTKSNTDFRKMFNLK